MIPAGLKVNGGRNTRFTGTFTVAFTLMANLTCVRRDGCGRNDGLLCTWPNHRTGRERPHFLADDPLKSSAGSLPPSQQLRRRVLRGCIHRPENLSDRMSDILHEGERRSPLSILKSPPKQPKAVAIQARVEESVKTQLELYAEFIDASPSYVITEALKLLFRKDDDFRRWADQHANNHNNGKAKGDVLAKAV